MRLLESWSSMGCLRQERCRELLNPSSWIVLDMEVGRYRVLRSCHVRSSQHICWAVQRCKSTHGKKNLPCPLLPPRKKWKEKEMRLMKRGLNMKCLRLGRCREQFYPSSWIVLGMKLVVTGSSVHVMFEALSRYNVQRYKSVQGRRIIRVRRIKNIDKMG